MSMMQSVKAVFQHADDQDKLVTIHTVDDTEIEGRLINIDNNFVFINIQYAEELEGEKLILLNIDQVKRITLEV
jgi:small nuclear ribonucleoprotein (snRNP)-like protein